MKRHLRIACLLLVAAGCRTPTPPTPVSQAEAMAVVADLCTQRCTEFEWVDHDGYMMVKGITKEPRVPMDDLIRDALDPYGWSIWIPPAEFFPEREFRVGIKRNDPNKPSEATP